MKIRSGFVSNSSSSSFCILGWKENELKNLGYEGIYDFMSAVHKEFKVNLVHSFDPNFDEVVVGVGNSETEFDHYMEDWEDYECNPPTDKEIKTIEEVGIKFHLSSPQYYSATWFDG